MSKSGKDIVRGLYESDFLNDASILKKYLHPDAELYWNASTGFSKMTYRDIASMSSEMGRSFISLRPSVSHVMEDGDQVCIRLTYYLHTIENPEEEVAIIHFMAIWELKDGKLYKGYQISQPSDEDPQNTDAYKRIKS
ncbi:nuclear transport factor 2 family protein [Leeuwenhoekiella sp. A16]|uniref:nuclear transport factor 2 family protein n=1 Tax=unclassified Leeuwenhoekiella TaxID=2615029 RepID=UPI003A80F714|tara:strand:+ start:782 stop:1195 length:414 start_codon:yes stop_codon:yes gene_type:complete